MLSMDGWRRNMASNVEIPVETMTGIVGKEVSRARPSSGPARSSSASR